MKKPNDKNELTSSEADIVDSSEMQTWMTTIRPEWKDKRLIQRVQKLIPIDQSSACQRILNPPKRDGIVEEL